MKEAILKKAIASRVFKHKNAKNDLVSILKKLKVKFPTKEQAEKYLRENIKSEKDIENAYKIVPQLLGMLKKSYITADKQIFPKGFIKNLILLIAIISFFQGTFPVQSEAVKRINKEVTIGFEPIGHVNYEDAIKLLDKGDEIYLAKSKIIKSLKNKELRLIGGKLPGDIKSHQLLLSRGRFDSFINSKKDLDKEYKGILYLHKDTPNKKNYIK
ncbi:hypothetical protein N9948_02100 [bacterium]|nr:hypothetical protein [bacterium]